MKQRITEFGERTLGKVFVEREPASVYSELERRNAAGGEWDMRTSERDRCKIMLHLGLVLLHRMTRRWFEYWPNAAQDYVNIIIILFVS